MKQEFNDRIEGDVAGNDVVSHQAPVVKLGSVFGGTNIIGNQGGVHVQIATTAPARPRVVIQPGPEHINDAQKIALAALRDEWLTLHATLKKKPLSHSVAWTRINKAAGATSYHLILKDRYEDALNFIKVEMAKLRGMRSAPAKDGEWRSKRIGAIKARCKNQLGDIEAYKPYIRKNFKADSLSDLATDDLQRTYAYIMAKKPV